LPFGEHISVSTLV